MKLQHFLGEFKDMAAVQAAFPSGGREGDYLVVDGVIKGWDIESNTWADPIKKDVAPVRETEQVFGDLDVHHNIRVGGNLSAKLIRGRNAFLGLFDTENDLPKHPCVGEWAMVFAYTSTPANAEEETPAASEQTQESASNAETSSENTETRRTENELCVGYIFTCEVDGVWKNTGYKGGFGSNMFEAVEAEKERAQAAEETLQGNINAEEARATEAEEDVIYDVSARNNGMVYIENPAYLIPESKRKNGMIIKFLTYRANCIVFDFGTNPDSEQQDKINNAIRLSGKMPFDKSGRYLIPAVLAAIVGTTDYGTIRTAISENLQEVDDEVAFYTTVEENEGIRYFYYKIVRELGAYAFYGNETATFNTSASSWISIDFKVRENSQHLATSGMVYDAVKAEEERAHNAEEALQGNIDAEVQALQSEDETLQDNIDTINSKIPSAARQDNQLADKKYVDDADETLQGNIEAIESLIPEQADAENQLADKNFVNSGIATATATHRGSWNLVLDLMLPVDATRTQIANKLASIIATADNNDYVFVQVPNTAENPLEILRVERYKYNGTAWAFEYELNNSSFTAAQWAALNSGITAAKVAEFAAEKQRSIAKDAELESAISTEEIRAKGVEGNLQQQITSENNRATTIEGNLNTAISSENTRAIAEEGRIEGRVRIVEDKIPSQASAQNQLTDKNYVDSSIATATATHRGTYNLVSDLALPVNVTRTQIANRIASKLTELGLVADNNDYVFVQIPSEASKPLEILRVERYKNNGTAWGFEYELNNSSFTAAQWAALNSGITNTQRETMQADIAANQAKIAALAAGIDVNISFNPSVIYKNVETSVTVTGTMVNGVPTNMKLMDGETVIHEGAASPLSDQVHVNISTNTKTFKVVGESSGVTLSKEGNVAARYPIYYGFNVSPSVLAVDDLARYAPTTSAAHTYSRENNRDGNHFYILVPSDISALSSFTMNGAPFVMAASTEVINGITYKVYTSGNTYNAGTQVTVVAS